jgi:hypothetical protein
MHIMIVLTFLQQSLALKSKNQITSPELAALWWNLLSLHLDNRALANINPTEIVCGFD